jgi:hypothetical protein
LEGSNNSFRCRSAQILVFPEADNHPAEAEHLGVRISISSNVGLDLLSPVCRVRLRSGVVLRAAMPEASVDEDRKLLAREHNVGASAPIEWKWLVDAEAKTGSVEG